MTRNSHTQVRKNPLLAGFRVRVRGIIGASTVVLGTTTAGDFINDCYIGATSMHVYSGTRSCVCHPARRSSALASRLGGGA